MLSLGLVMGLSICASGRMTAGKKLKGVGFQGCQPYMYIYIYMQTYIYIHICYFAFFAQAFASVSLFLTLCLSLAEFTHPLSHNHGVPGVWTVPVEGSVGSLAVAALEPSARQRVTLYAFFVRV